MKNVINGKVSSWAVRWYASVFLSDKLTLFPSHSLVNHIGNEGTNVRVNSSYIFGNSVYDQPVTNFEDSIVENGTYRKLLSAHFYKFNLRRLTLRNIKYYYQRSLVFFKKA